MLSIDSVLSSESLSSWWMICIFIAFASWGAWKLRGLKFKYTEERLRIRMKDLVVFQAESAAQLLEDAAQFNRYPEECRLSVDLLPFEKGDLVREVRCVATTWDTKGNALRDTLIELYFSGWDNEVVERSVLTEFEPLRHKRFDFERIHRLREFLYQVPHYDRRHIEKEQKRKWEQSAASGSETAPVPAG